MKFYRIEYQSIMSGLTVHYRILNDQTDFKITASRSGVMIHGESNPLDAQDIDDVKSVLDRAVEISHGIARMKEYKITRRPLWFEFAKDPPCVIELYRAHFAGEDELLERRGLQADADEGGR